MISTWHEIICRVKSLRTLQLAFKLFVRWPLCHCCSCASHPFDGRDVKKNRPSWTRVGSLPLQTRFSPIIPTDCTLVAVFIVVFLFTFIPSLSTLANLGCCWICYPPYLKSTWLLWTAQKENKAMIWKWRTEMCGKAEKLCSRSYMTPEEMRAALH